jgi:hypothetical protein
MFVVVVSFGVMALVSWLIFVVGGLVVVAVLLMFDGVWFFLWVVVDGVLMMGLRDVVGVVVVVVVTAAVAVLLVGGGCGVGFGEGGGSGGSSGELVWSIMVDR